MDRPLRRCREAADRRLWEIDFDSSLVSRRNGSGIRPYHPRLGRDSLGRWDSAGHARRVECAVRARGLIKPAHKKIGLLFVFERLDLLLVFLGGFTCIERAEIFAFPRFRVLLFRVKAVFTRFELSDHLNAPTVGVQSLCVAREAYGPDFVSQ